MGTLWNKEPAVFLAVINAAIALAIGFGLKLSQEQLSLIMAFITAVFGLITRTQVTPVNGGDQ